MDKAAWRRLSVCGHAVRARGHSQGEKTSFLLIPDSVEKLIVLMCPIME